MSQSLLSATIHAAVQAPLLNHNAIRRSKEAVSLECEQQPEEQTFAVVLDRLSRLPAEHLGNHTVIANLVREVGLVRDLRRPLYGWPIGKGCAPECEGRWMHQRDGYGMYQLPEQVGCLLSGLASLPTRVRTFIEVGAWYGWTGLFFAVFARRLFESSLPGSPHSLSKTNRKRFASASFDVYDLRTPCVKGLMGGYGHNFYLAPRSGKNVLKLVENETAAAAAAWYSQSLAETFGWTLSADLPTAEGAPPQLHSWRHHKIDLCFIDAAHGFRHVVADVRYFQPRCRFLLFHDISDVDSRGVVTTWRWLSTRLKQERKRRIASEGLSATHSSDSWAVEEGYYVKECTQQVATNRRNFGLGLISAQRLQSSWLDGPPPKTTD